MKQPKHQVNWTRYWKHLEKEKYRSLTKLLLTFLSKIITGGKVKKIDSTGWWALKSIQTYHNSFELISIVHSTKIWFLGVGHGHWVLILGLLYKSQNVLEIDAYWCYSSAGEHMVGTSDNIKMKARRTPCFSSWHNRQVNLTKNLIGWAKLQWFVEIPNDVALQNS